MLNRRTLRIKTMQAIFAYQQSKESNYNIAFFDIDKAFAPDLNSMEVQDTELLKKQKSETKELFKANFLHKGIEVKSSEDSKVNEITTESIASYHKRIENDRSFFMKQMVNQAEKIFDWYVLMLQLLVEFAELAAADKKLPSTNYVKNLLIEALKFNKSLESAILKNNLSWKDNRSEVKSWYKELLRNDKTFIDYLDKTSPDFESDVEIVQHIIKSIFKNELFTAFMEEQDINWAEDKAIIRSMTLKTLKEIKADNANDFSLMELSYNWEDDKAFFIDLYKNTLNLDKDLKDLIANRTKNWDIDRLASIDRIALEMAVTEMTTFASIPVKVTINEYIELVKNYSTPKSKQFINGILDAISKDLIDSGKIRKSGRGLIDNR